MILPLASGIFPSLAPSGRSAIWAVTGRLGGSSEEPFSGANLADHVGDRRDHVESNRGSLASLVGLDREDLAIMAPVHGGDVAFVNTSGSVKGVDSLVTAQTRIGLVAMGADCATVGLCGTREDHHMVIAAVHCGWKGLCADVLGNTLMTMSEWGATKFKAILGPAICGTCYKVSSERTKEIRDHCRASIVRAALSVNGGIDVRSGLQAHLAELGIAYSLYGGCTAESSEELFSYRRSGRTGRQGLVITMKDSMLKDSMLKESVDE